MEEPDLSVHPFLIGWLPLPAEQALQRMSRGAPTVSQPRNMWEPEALLLFHSVVLSSRDLWFTLYPGPGTHHLVSQGTFTCCLQLLSFLACLHPSV